MKKNKEEEEEELRNGTKRVEGDRNVPRGLFRGRSLPLSRDVGRS